MPNSRAIVHSYPTRSFREFPRAALEQSIVARFEQVVDECPDRLAVRTPEHSLTYRELNAWANRIAKAILERGGYEKTVGLLIEQGAPLIAAILGVLKSGRAYLPLDPRDPSERSAITLRTTGTDFLLVDRVNAAAHPEAPHSHLVLNIDDVDPTGPTSNPGLPITSKALAYVFQTSGSTGPPKRIADTHRNVLHNIMRYTNSLHISCEDRLTLLQAAHFSGSVSSMFGALLNGAAVFPYDVRRNGAGRPLAEWLIREGLTMYHSVPSVFRSAMVDDVRFPAIRIVRLEGDAASRLDVELFRKHFDPGCLLVNGLGATETGLTRQFFMNHDTPLPGDIVPLGYATTDMRAMIVDDLDRELPPGEVGEIVIESEYLAAGHDRYRTGDMGRMREDGCLEYSGRKDGQLKIRGHRVNLTEVEAAMLCLPEVREVAATTLLSESGEAQLVAYVVASGPSRLTTSSVRDRLAVSLPEYLIPSRVIAIDAVPLNGNGKVDRRRLPPPAELSLDRGVEYVAPATDVECEIARIWEKVLGVRGIGVRDNFFDLGGDSLKAATVCDAFARKWQVDPPLSLLAASPTIEALAASLHEAAKGPPGALVAIQPRGTRPPFFCVHPHHGNVLSFAALARELGTDQPFYGLQSTNGLPEKGSVDSIERMADRYVRAIRRVQPRGPYHLGGFCLGGVVAFEMARQLEAAGESVGSLILIDSNPTEFPGVVPFAAFERFRQHLHRKRMERHSAEMAKRGVWRGIGYLAGGMSKKLQGKLWRLGVRTYSTVGVRLPDWLRSAERRNRAAQEAYRPGRCASRMTLIQPEEDRELFAQDPRDDWGDLTTGGYSVHFVRGAQGEFFRDPQVKALAAAFREILRERPASLVEQR